MTSVSSALVIGTLMAVGTALMYSLGSLHVLEGRLSLGTLLIFASYLVMLYQPLGAADLHRLGAGGGRGRCPTLF